MGFGSIGGYNPNLNAYGAGKVKKPAEGEQQGETKGPELNMVDTKGSETNTNVKLSGLDALATYGQANVGKPVVPTGGTDEAPVITQDEKSYTSMTVDFRYQQAEAQLKKFQEEFDRLISDPNTTEAQFADWENRFNETMAQYSHLYRQGNFVMR